MLTLALDTSGFAGSVAVLDDNRVLAELELNAERRSAQTLAPAIAEGLRLAGVKASDVRLVATTVGPGSFTGLRVGVTTAKAFAYATRADVLAISTLEVIAHQTPRDLLRPGAEIHAILDALRQELFVGQFRHPGKLGDDALQRQAADGLMKVDAWLQSLTPGAIVTGSGLRNLAARLPESIVRVDAGSWQPRAATVGQIACLDYQSGRRDDVWALAPIYLRPSYAEEKASQAPQV